MNVIGHKIIELCEEIDMKQVTLAKAIGVTKPTMSRYVSGETIPNAYVLSKIADILKTSTDYLIGRTNIRTPIGVNENKYWKNLDSKENDYISHYRKLSDENKGKLSERMIVLLETQEKSTAIKMD